MLGFDSARDSIHELILNLFCWLLLRLMELSPKKPQQTEVCVPSGVARMNSNESLEMLVSFD